ncbi:hypothetical protein K9K77_00600 [Candidatus Babeliales bacterium]|nr:hypothetical protein [Candidatus Babeliales bacterium]
MKFLLLTSLMFTPSLYTFQSLKKQISGSSPQTVLIPDTMQLTILPQPQQHTDSVLKSKIIIQTLSLQTLLEIIQEKSNHLPEVTPEKEINDFFNLFRDNIKTSSHNKFHAFVDETLHYLEEETTQEEIKMRNNVKKLFSQFCIAIPKTDSVFSEQEKTIINKIISLYECKIIPSI